MEKNEAQEEHVINEENICHMYCIEKTRRRTKNENEVCKYFETNISCGGEEEQRSKRRRRTEKEKEENMFFWRRRRTEKEKGDNFWSRIIYFL